MFLILVYLLFQELDTSIKAIRNIRGEMMDAKMNDILFNLRFLLP